VRELLAEIVFAINDKAGQEKSARWPETSIAS